MNCGLSVPLSLVVSVRLSRALGGQTGTSVRPARTIGKGGDEMPKLRQWVSRIEKDLGMRVNEYQRQLLIETVAAIQREAVGVVVGELEEMVVGLREAMDR